MLKRYAFILGFAGGFLIFVAVNLLAYMGVRGCCEGDAYAEIGVPFLWYTTGGFVGVSHIIWSGLIADLIIAVGVGYAIGKIIGWVFGKTS